VCCNRIPAFNVRKWQNRCTKTEDCNDDPSTNRGEPRVCGKKAEDERISFCIGSVNHTIHVIWGVCLFPSSMCDYRFHQSAAFRNYFQCDHAAGWPSNKLPWSNKEWRKFIITSTSKRPTSIFFSESLVNESYKLHSPTLYLSTKWLRCHEKNTRKTRQKRLIRFKHPCTMPRVRKNET
jgi:hypothetical protein